MNCLPEKFFSLENFLFFTQHLSKLLVSMCIDTTKIRHLEHLSHSFYSQPVLQEAVLTCAVIKGDSLLALRYQISRSGITGLLSTAELETIAGHLSSVQAKH